MVYGLTIGMITEDDIWSTTAIHYPVPIFQIDYTQESRVFEISACMPVAQEDDSIAADAAAAAAAAAVFDIIMLLCFAQPLAAFSALRSFGVVFLAETSYRRMNP